uniref:Uncharacterized protein n=1 Tax=Arundo donax TaxID=35708 RepID=A0A0A8ZPI2_ARUDO
MNTEVANFDLQCYDKDGVK